MLTIGRRSRDKKGQMGYLVTAMNPFDVKKVSPFFVSEEVIEMQDHKRICKCLTAEGIKLASENVSLYFVIAEKNLKKMSSAI